MLALAEQRQRAEADERREKLLARVTQLGSTTGWAQLLGRQPQAKDGAGSAKAGPEGSADGGVGTDSGAAESGGRPRVALLTLCGPIVLGPGSDSAVPSPRSSPAQIASLPVIQALRRARLDPAVKAVVLRVDSPGGRPSRLAAACGGVVGWAGLRPVIRGKGSSPTAGLRGKWPPLRLRRSAAGLQGREAPWARGAAARHPHPTAAPGCLLRPSLLQAGLPPPRTPSIVRWSCCARPASRWWPAWATPPPAAATSSPHPPPRLWRSQAPSRDPSAC